MNSSYTFKRNKLTLIKALPSGNGKRPRHLFQCECGQFTAVYFYNVVNNVTKSCGCLKAIRYSKHPTRLIPEYSILLSIRQRCTNPNNKDYPRLNKLPQPIDPRWLRNSKAFLEDMGRRPKEGYFLLRKDKGIGFCKDNCFWGTKQELNVPKDPENIYGRRPKHTFMGSPIFVKNFADFIDQPISTIYTRLRRGNTLDQIYQELLSNG